MQPIIKKTSFQVPPGIRTLYDDIQEDIRLEKAKKYFEQNISSKFKPKTYTLGSVIGDKLKKIV